MVCTKCGKEMRKGYLFASKDGAFSFANEVPGVFEKADKADGFIEITSLKPGHRTSIAAECCEECRMLVIGYQEHTYKQFDFIVSPAKLLTPEIVQMVSSIHEHKGKQELFLEANVDELKTLLEVALIQSTGASNRIEGIFTSDKRLEELVSQKAEPRNLSEQEIAGYREVLSTIYEGYEYINPRPNIILQLH